MNVLNVDVENMNKKKYNSPIMILYEEDNENDFKAGAKWNKLWK